MYSLEREGVSWMGAGARVEGSLFIREGEDWEPGPAIGQYIRYTLMGQSNVGRSFTNFYELLNLS